MVTKNNMFGDGKHDFVYLLYLGAQSGSKGVHKAAQGCPWDSKWLPKGLKRVRKWSPKVAINSKIMPTHN